jgi:DNA-3-methyladenine glycosylase
MRFEREYFLRDALEVGPEILGHYLIRKIDDKLVKTMIVEVEAYVGPDDKGAHTYNNRRTARTEPMFSIGGYAYVYLIYGMYNCINIVCQQEGKPEALLIRAVEPLNEIDILTANRNSIKNIHNLSNGPGKLCSALKIDRTFSGYDLINGKELYLEVNEEKKDFEIVRAKRIGIDYAGEYKDKLWRFYIKNNKFISKK